MIYSTDEKQRLDNILGAFHDYISNHTFFDIVYSDKIGYFRVQINDPDGEGLVVIHSVDKLLDVLFNEIINDIRFDKTREEHYFSKLSEDEMEEARRRITEILKNLDVDADYCLNFLDTYLEDYQNNDIDE